MANPQIRIFDLPLVTGVNPTLTTEFVAIESSVAGGRKISLTNFALSLSSTLATTPSVTTDNSIVRYSGTTGALQYGYTGTIPTISDAGVHTAAGYAQTSARKYKENILPIINPLQKIDKLQGVSYNLIGQPETSREIGLIADDVQWTVPEVVGMKDGLPETVQYDRIVALLIAAVQELSKEVDYLKSHNN